MSAASSQTLDALHLPLHGTRLIEASAGTGKTYTIANLYLRLLLGLGEQGASETPLKVDEILVVTFTNAATSELRDRIRRRIQQAFRAFLGLRIKDGFIEALLDGVAEQDRPMALRRLDAALKGLDEAAIYTIHGFCQRVLADMAFESALLFESEFTLDDSEYLQRAVRDFWRAHCYGMAPELAALIRAKFESPDALMSALRPLLGAQDAVPAQSPAPFEQAAQDLSQGLARMRLSWPRDRDATLALLTKLPLNGTSYGKQADGYPKLADMFLDMDNWCRFGSGLPPAKVLSALALGNIKLNKGGSLPSPQQAPLLAQIEALAHTAEQLLPAFLVTAREEIRQRFHALKRQQQLLSPDDLLLTLAGALEGEDKTLASVLRRRFPIALIDEFQDTDPLQFAIFGTIYPEGRLLMIGDPKQAIYAFRGGDIHTYLKARATTTAQYHLGTNYRSAESMVAGVNRLFQAREDAFIDAAIPFDAVDSQARGEDKSLKVGGHTAPGLQLRLLAEDPVTGLNKTDARARLAEDAAAEICRLLTLAADGEAQIVKESKEKPLLARDIAVLVRDRNEAAVMRDALAKRRIGAVFLSRDSVFDTLEARELALVLLALAKPRDEQAIRAAMATELWGGRASDIHGFNVDEDKRAALLEQFANLHLLWQRQGVMPALMQLATETGLLERLKGHENAERRLTDIRHLSELLQQKASELDGMAALLHWYEQELCQVSGGEEQQLRLESEQNLVQIVTIHKSKGLEYGVCFIPFISLARDQSRKPTPLLYHSDKGLCWDLGGSDEAFERWKQEQLAEDLRLLYVALTRPVYRCYLYIANHSRMLKAGLKSHLHQTAIGYCLGIDNEDCDSQLLAAKAKALAGDIMALEWVAAEADNRVLPTTEHQGSELLLRKPRARDAVRWRVGSYSALVKDSSHGSKPGAADEHYDVLESLPSPRTTETSLDRFGFDRGANAGSFMHLVLELFDFTRADTELQTALTKAMAQYGIADHWFDMLKDWYLSLLQAPLDGGQLTLSGLAAADKLVEMEFYLPVMGLNPDKLSALLGRYGYGSQYSFETLCGMLKGFIDLVFCHGGRFYVADYKSNHLGHDFSCYDRQTMASAIRDHHYDLQYLLYSLALHRFLHQRLPDYDYERDFGGVYYLFLRGMHATEPGKGIFYDRPPKALIEELDKMFTGEPG
ncbi:exodeoxyribonuclease V subunit beta [Shewanella cyperi]|uniref:RecBCD enzyme subunit RecB n=1 Tax=Shewanella cyperi TaxID=2814292 RepID=A0A975AM78_9GAMM|nr:exodeoxyribonuclease V subunit beta [Shewanella cyperi]QSX31561.1 exodeoxyribonuclease V subunit beta [Shewanella cyperi]